MQKLLPFFSFQGRTNRQPYWLTSLAIYGMFLVVALVSMLIPILGPILGLVAFLAFLWAGMAVAVRRLHDRNKSAWWLIPMYLPVFLLSALGQAASMSDPTVGAFFNLLTLPFSIWIFVELGCLRGTRGSNRYGADPLEPVSEVFA